MDNAALQSFEPTHDALAAAQLAYQVELIAFHRELEKLRDDDFLPRYNRLKIRLSCRVLFSDRPLYLTVRRSGSKIGADNFYTVPLWAGEMPVGSKATYEVLSFDSFNLPFKNISVELCQPEDYVKRRISAEHLERAKSFITQREG